MDTSIAIVGKSNDFRSKLEQSLKSCKNFKLICSCASGEEALIKLSVSRPEVVIIDPELDGISGIEMIRSLKEYFPKMLFMICSDNNSEEKIFEAIYAGVNGFRTKKEINTGICEAIKQIRKGEAVFCGGTAMKIIHAIRNKTDSFEKNALLKKLTERELEMLEALSKGMMYKQMSIKFGISTDTVRKHIGAIFSKLNVNNRVAAVNKYYGR